MAFNQELADRIAAALHYFPASFTSKKMFGGIAYLYKGKMTIGAINEDLMVRIVANKIEGELQKECVRPMDFTGTAMKEFVFVAEKGYRTEEQLQYWIELGVEHAKKTLNEL